MDGYKKAELVYIAKCTTLDVRVLHSIQAIRSPNLLTFILLVKLFSPILLVDSYLWSDSLK